MDLKALVGQTLCEHSFYESLKFVFETDQESYKDHWLHIYFRKEAELILIEEVAFLESCEHLRKLNKTQLG